MEQTEYQRRLAKISELPLRERAKARMKLIEDIEYWG